MSTRSPISTRTLVVLTSVLFSLGPVTVDLSLPALPAMQRAIGSPALRAELSLTAIFFGMALGQFLFGAIADRHGRRPTLLLSLGVFTAAATAAAAAPDMALFIGLRFVQAMGYAVATVLSRSIVADVCDGRDVARIFSKAFMAMALVTVLAPVFGGEVLTHFGWRAVLLAMAAVGAVTIAFVAVSVPETLPQTKRSRGGWTQAASEYAGVLRSRTFVLYAVLAGCSGGIQFAYNTGAPSALIEHDGLAASTAGICLGIIAISMAAAAQLNAWLLKVCTPLRILFYAAPVAFLAAILVLASSASGFLGAAGLTAALTLAIAMNGFLGPNAMAGAMTSAGNHVGAASALLGVSMFLFGTIGSGLISGLHDRSGTVMSLVIVSWACLGLLQVVRLRRQSAASEAVPPPSAV